MTNIAELLKDAPKGMKLYSPLLGEVEFAEVMDTDYVPIRVMCGVIGRDGKVFYGHRPDPKEVTMVDGKPYHAKTYDKNGWNWPDIALWLDVEVPQEQVDKIVTEYFKENKKPPKKEE